jgi:6,7-dimethyl-8-ribityllumazine synthase
MAGKASGGGPESARIKAHVLIIEARFYEDIADELAAGAIGELEARGATYERVAVPGALEIPQVLGLAAEAGRLEEEADGETFDGVIALGCVIRGETYHFEVVCNETNHWLMEAASMFATPVGNAILTVDTKEQALARARGGRDGKGGDAARACLRLIEIRRAFGGV